MNNVHFKTINPTDYMDRTLDLLQELNPKINRKQLEKIQFEMAQLPNYTCFGLFMNDLLVGISSGWTTLRIYCGKQLELDNVIIDPNIQSQGFGKFFMEAINDWSIKNDYESLGLNTYVQNPRSHKFYFNEGFKILGFHFEKRIS